MKTLSIVACIITLTGCLHRHTHYDYEAIQSANDNAETCNYVMATWSTECDVEHGDRTKGAITSYSGTQPITPTTLNSNFSHIHNNMVGGHGARLVDADVNASAAISTSKLAAYRFIPIAWARVAATCSGSPCTIVEGSSRITSITRGGLGTYDINVSPALTDTAIALIVTANDAANARLCYMDVAASTTSAVRMLCDSDLASANADAAFSLVIFDGD